MKVIAELGSNWKSLDDCKNAIHLAKACGADAIKFQLFTAKELWGVGTSPIEHSLNPEWLPILKEKANYKDIEFMCTAFSPEGYDAVNPFVNMHKVASAEMTHVRILEKVASYKKPIILSTGASGPKDIEMALKVLEGCQVVLLYCVASYPAREIDFRQLEALKRYGHPVGYSDHSTDVLCIPSIAQAAGATVIEKHFNPFNYTDTPDAGHSLNVEQFKKMVKHIKGELPFTWGSGEENEMITKHNRRLIVTKDINIGEALVENENFGIYRSLAEDFRGLSPFAIASVHGKVARKKFKAGEAIGPGDFE